MNEDLLRFHDWFFDKRLLINPDKTKLIIYGSRQMTERLPQFHLSLLGKELAPTQSVQDLGVTFDKNLTFNNHVANTVSSCMSELGQISHVKYVFNEDLQIMITNALVVSKLYYCSSVWSNTTGTNIRKLQGVQNFAVCIVSNIIQRNSIM